MDLKHYLNRLREQLWFRPFIFCILSIAGALIARMADGTGLKEMVPDIKTDSLEGLLDTISSTMLVISIFAVASMISAFSSASSTATPRSFKIVVTDDVSQNALSVFIGAFIYSIVATVALSNGYYGDAGRFILFVFTLILFAVVILTFLRWVDRISRLGRLDHTILQVEQVATKALTHYLKNPHLKGVPLTDELINGTAIEGESIGYIQHINLEALQNIAEEADIKMRLNCLPGTFLKPNQPIVYITDRSLDIENLTSKINDAFSIGNTRFFDNDPRFGIIALTEIASRALSPGINDPGTAIQIIGSHIRLFSKWQSIKAKDVEEVCYDRIEVPQINIIDFFEDAFRPIARDGAGNIEVMLRLQKAFTSIMSIDDPKLQKAAIQYSELSYRRAEQVLEFKEDLELLKKKSLIRLVKS
jgi:uncharacterized membrane protein